MESEKVLNGLRCHAGCERGFDCDDCAYIGNGDCSELLARDALSLIQELMDRMIPKEMELEGGGSCWWYVCPECHGAVDHQDSYCRHCGQALK